jgi:hypothetical protein
VRERARACEKKKEEGGRKRRRSRRRRRRERDERKKKDTNDPAPSHNTSHTCARHPAAQHNRILPGP